MPDASADLPDIPGSSSDPQFFYTVLNLPTTALDQEIRERYRQLSIIFHPDKQHDEETKETATRRFLEVQKAYQVLSDPVTRRAYDLLGPEGLKEVDTASFSGLSSDELDQALVRQGYKVKQEYLEDTVRSRGRLNVEVDASSLFSEEGHPYAVDEPWPSRVMARVRMVERSGFTLRHSFQKAIDDKTLLTFSSRGGGNSRGSFMGTIRHQYSPNWNFEATTSLLNPTLPTAKAIWHDDNSTVMVQSHLAALWTRLFGQTASRRLPPMTLAFTRRLFPESATEGQMVISTSNAVPMVTLSISSTRLFDHTPEGAVPALKADRLRPPSRFGFALGDVFWSAGLVLADLASGPTAEVGLHLRELGVRVKTTVQANVVTGVNWLVGCEWRRQENLVGANIGLNHEGVMFRFDVMYLGQYLSFPITLAHEHEPGLAFWTALVPSAAFVVSYYYILLPRRRQQRIQYFRRLRQELREEKADVLRETKETARLLQDTARRHMQAEEACNGLVIQEATYGPTERDDSTDGLDVDVTIALQALVSRSQLYIPGRRSKAGLQGFYDPAAHVAKELRVRYTFRGRAHYAEVPDHMPLVLPLEEHLVE